MKKLSLKNLKLEASDLLQRNQLKTVFGGYGGYFGGSQTKPCRITCANGVTLEGGPHCPTQTNIDIICREIGGTTPGTCECMHA